MRVAKRTERKLVKNARIQQRHLSLLQSVKPSILETVRDLLLEGNDVDALAILAQELDLVPRHRRCGIMPLQIRDVPAHTNAFRRMWSITADDQMFLPLRFGVTEETGKYFSIDSIVDLGPERHLLDRPIAASVFVAVRTDYHVDLNLAPGGGIVALRWGSGIDSAKDFGMALPFGRGWIRGDAVELTVSNETSHPRDFVGFIVGEIYTAEEWRARRG